MRKIAISVLCFFTICIAAYNCVGTSSQQDNVIVQMDEVKDRIINGSASDLSATVTLMPIETKDSILIDGNPMIKLIDDENIIIESGRRLYRFDKHGVFKNFIGKPGQGPGEYIAPGRVSYDNKGKLLYLFTSNQLQQWTLDGVHLKTIDLPDRNTLISVSLLAPDTLFVIRREYLDEGAMSQCLQWCDLDGGVLYEKDFQSDSTKIDIMMYASPEQYRIDNEEYIRLEWDNAVYKITNRDINLYKKLDFGHRNPSRLIFQDSGHRHLLSDQNVNITRCLVAAGGIFLTYILDNRLNYVVFDSKNNVVHHSVSNDSYHEPQGFAIDNSNIHFWPSYIDADGNVYSLIQPGDLSEDELSGLNSLIDGEVNITEYDNPVICKVAF